MTRDKANEVLYLWKVGAELFPPHIITAALYATGDLNGPTTSMGRRALLTLGTGPRMEGSRPVASVGDASRVSVFVRQVAGVGAVGGREGDGAKC